MCKGTRTTRNNLIAASLVYIAAELASDDINSHDVLEILRETDKRAKDIPHVDSNLAQQRISDVLRTFNL